MKRQFKYCERVQQAIDHSGLIPAEIARQIQTLPGGEKFKPQMISRMLDKNTKSSMYTAHLAIVCKVSSEYLAAQIGDLLDVKAPKSGDIDQDALFLAQTIQKLPETVRNALLDRIKIHVMDHAVKAGKVDLPELNQLERLKTSRIKGDLTPASN